uniref:Uncharacterized protein n=1 Tax=Cucumis melo TaxID=3656 RepID=A0A9I9EA37_CUCME
MIDADVDKEKEIEDNEETEEDDNHRENKSKMVHDTSNKVKWQTAARDNSEGGRRRTAAEQRRKSDGNGDINGDGALDVSSLFPSRFQFCKLQN